MDSDHAPGTWAAGNNERAAGRTSYQLLVTPPGEELGTPQFVLRCASLAGTRHGMRGSGCRNDGHTVDALALVADEGRGHATKCPGEALAACDPGMSEWGNPAGVMTSHPFFGGGNRGN